MSGNYPDGVNQRVHDEAFDQLGPEPDLECPECGEDAVMDRDGPVSCTSCDWSLDE